MTIYRSTIPPCPVALESTFTHLFRSKYYQFPPNSPAYIDAYTGRTLTRGDVFDLTRSFAWGLRNEFYRLGGVPMNRGDTLFLVSPNSLAWPVILYGAVAAGVKVSPANPAYTPSELLFQYKDSGSKMVVAHPTVIPNIVQMFKLHGLSEAEARKRIVVASWASTARAPEGFVTMDQLLDKGIMEQEEQFLGELANEVLFLCYSSGTTGKPKGVETVHTNINTMGHMTRGIFPSITPEQGDVMLGFLPFFHIFGIVSVLNLPLTDNVPVVIMSHFEPNDFCRFVEKYKITCSLVVPPVCLALVHHPATTKYNMKSLKYMLSGAAPLGEPLVLAVRKKLESVGADVEIFQGYGLTETSPTVTILPHYNYLKKVGSIGVLVPNWECRLVVDDVEEAKPGEPGEMWVRGPAVMKGYLNNKEATENALTKDGWFKTGDIAIRDPDGYFYIVDRRKELIKYKGFQVPPAELESLLLSHPDIVDAAVIGVESVKQATELPRAYVVRRPGLSSHAHEVNAWIADVQKWVQSRVVKHKYLRGGIFIIDAIPKSAAGKILRKDLRERAKKEMKKVGAKL